MLTMKSSSNEPFWIDEPNPYSRAHSSATKWSPTWWVLNLFTAYAIIVRLFIFLLIIFLAIRFPLLWIAVAFEALLLSARLLLPHFRETLQAKAIRIQLLAKDMTGANLLGSAIHTAGHPLLQANQPIVLALKGYELSIYGYDHSTPIDTIPVKALQAVDLVIFDDNRMPHIGVIDNAAQALQITFPWRTSSCTCSFRRMYKVRAIEWYQAIQKARLVDVAG